MFDNKECSFWSREVNQNFSERFDKCSQKFGKAVVVLGDSHAMNLYNIFGKADFYPFVVGVSQAGCRVYDYDKKCHYDKFSEFLRSKVKNIKLIIYHQSGSYFVQDENGHVDSSLAFETGKPHQFAARDIEAVMDYVVVSNEQVKTIWMGPFVESRVNFKNIGMMLRTHEINPNSMRIFKELDQHIMDMNNKRPEDRRVKFISLVDALNLDGTFLRSADCITYRDTDHFSLCGEDILARRLKPALNELLKLAH